MLSRFFIDRPVFALVISIVIALLGAVAVPSLPIEETPDITPPTVSIIGIWPGASAPVIADNVAVPIEQQVVVENTTRLMDEEGLQARAATAKAMEQVTGPVVATTPTTTRPSRTSGTCWSRSPPRWP